jgi:asparagine synthase (glutamine-hydrolysing)
MCGIAGILNVLPQGMHHPAPGDPPTRIPDSWLQCLDASIAHRGPDGSGTFRDRVERDDGSVVEVALVHRRLSILDHAGGRQPMVHLEPDSHGRARAVAVVFNGCIYNHRELRRELLAMGRTFSSDHSDTEVLLAGWLAWGSGVFDHLTGMVACLIWDARTATLTAFRSTPREKPLYRTQHQPPDPQHPYTLALSSQAAGLDALRTLAGWPRGDAEPQIVAPWLAFGHARDTTPFPGVDSPREAIISWPAPASVAQSPAQAPPPTRTSPHPASHQHSLEDAIDAAIREAVLARLDADVPLGCLLSGGVDSSLIAACAARAHPKLTTICVRMPEKAYDESEYAKAVARSIGSTHHTIDVSPKPAEDLVWLIDKLGLPLGDSSLLPTYWACKAAREHVGVALTGDGGDELFFGYERYQAARILRDWAWLLRLMPTSPLASGDPKSRVDKLRRLILAARERSSASIGAIFPRTMLRTLVDPQFAADVAWGELLSTDELRAWDLGQTLESDMLRKVDHASLSAGLEVRAPFLDQGLVARLAPLGSLTLMPGGELKGLLKRIARRYIPASVIDRPKMGFAIPIGEWFRTDFGGMRSLLLDCLGVTDPFPSSLLGLEIRRTSVRRLLDDHMERRQDHSQRLYMLLVLALWCRQTQQRRREATVA